MDEDFQELDLGLLWDSQKNQMYLIHPIVWMCNISLLECLTDYFSILFHTLFYKAIKIQHTNQCFSQITDANTSAHLSFYQSALWGCSFTYTAVNRVECLLHKFRGPWKYLEGNINSISPWYNSWRKICRHWRNVYDAIFKHKLWYSSISTLSYI